MAKAKTRKPKTPKVEWQPDSAVCEPLPVAEECEPLALPCSDVNPCSSDHVYETKGDAPAVVTRGDMNRLALDYILPQAAELCEEGILREKMLERDARHGPSSTYWMVEIAPNTYETTSRLPHGIPPLRFVGKASEAHWQYVQHLERYRIARGAASRKIARESTFLVAGKGVQT